MVLLRMSAMTTLNEKIAKHEQERVNALIANNSEGMHTGIFIREDVCCVSGTAVLWIETENGYYEMSGRSLHTITLSRFLEATESKSVHELKEKEKV
jgi:hypothetical protein